MPTTRGPVIITAISHSATTPISHAREMETEALYDALEMWEGHWARYQRAREDGLVEFRKLARKQLRLIRNELRRRDLPTTQSKKKETP